MPELPELLRGRSFVSVDLTFLRLRDGGQPVAQPLRQLPAQVMDTVGVVPLSRLGDIAAEPVDPMPTMEYSELLRPGRRDAGTAGRCSRRERRHRAGGGADPPPRRRAHPGDHRGRSPTARSRRSTPSSPSGSRWLPACRRRSRPGSRGARGAGRAAERADVLQLPGRGVRARLDLPRHRPRATAPGQGLHRPGRRVPQQSAGLTGAPGWLPNVDGRVAATSAWRRRTRGPTRLPPRPSDPSVWSCAPRTEPRVTPGHVAAPAPGTTLVRVLGPVTATVEVDRACISSPMQRALLGLLAVDAGRVVSVDRLISELWGDSPPDSATSTLQVYISRLRRSLGDTAAVTDPTVPPPVRIRRVRPGYLLELPDGALDVWRLTRLAEAARARVTTDPRSALALLDEGLSLVTGEPMVDVVDALGPVATAEAQRLSELVLQAQEARLEALLGVGRASGRGRGGGAPRSRSSAAREPPRPPAAGAVPQWSPDRGPGRLPGAARATGRGSGGRPRSSPAPSARSAAAAGLRAWTGPRRETAAVVRRCAASAWSSGNAGPAGRHPLLVGSRDRLLEAGRAPHRGGPRRGLGAVWRGRHREDPAGAGGDRGELGRPAWSWPTDEPKRRATTRRTGRGVRSSAISRACRGMDRPG